MRQLHTLALVATLLGAAAGCARPDMPSMTGPNMFHDIAQVRKGMGNNDVLRIMGSKYTPVYEEGLQGMDSGIYAWDYPEGRVYFNMDGVLRVQAAK